MGEVQDMRRVEWLNASRKVTQKPVWCIRCWDAPPTHIAPGTGERDLLVCESCARIMVEHQAKRAPPRRPLASR